MDFLDYNNNIILQFKEIKQVDYEPLDESKSSLSCVYRAIDDDNKEIKKGKRFVSSGTKKRV